MKKKLIAIVTSLAMVATMVPATAFAATATAAPKTVASTKAVKDVEAFKTLVSQLPAADSITKENAKSAYTVWNGAWANYAKMTTDEMGTVATEVAKFQAVGEKLADIYITWTEEEIAKIAQPGEVSAAETFDAVRENLGAVMNLLDLTAVTVKSRISNYSAYEAAQNAKTIAGVIDGQNKLGDDTATFAELKAAVEAVEGNATFKASNEQTRAMASNYKLYKDAKEALAKGETQKTLIETYTQRLEVQKEVLDNNQTAANVAAAEALIEEADNNRKLQKALTAYSGDPIATGYTAVKTALGTSITAAEAAIELETAANDFTTKVNLLPKAQDITLKDMAKIQEVYRLKNDASSNIAAPATCYDQSWGVKLTAATKDKADKAIAALKGIVTELNTIAQKSSTPAEIAAAAKAKKDFTDAAVTAFKLPTITIDAEDFVTDADTVIKTSASSAELVGVALTNLLDVTDAGVTTLAGEITEAKALIAKQKDTAKAAAIAFINTVVTLNSADKSAANYESKLNKATADYEALNALYKKGGDKYTDMIVTLSKQTGAAADGNVKIAYKDGKTNIPANAGATETYNVKSLTTLIKEYKEWVANGAQNALIKELIDGIDKLPNDATKLTAADETAVYALRDKRDALSEDNLDEFESTYKDYNDKLDEAIKAIDKLYVADLVKQIGELTVVKADASLEEIAAAEAANQAARAAYDALTDTQKERIINYETLKAAETAVSNAKIHHATTQMAAVLEGVDVDNMTVEQAKAILAVEDYIQSLTAAQRVEVEKDPNYAAFQAAAKAARGITPTEPSGPADLISVSRIATQVYTGKAITPNPVVKADGKTLVKDTDYTVTYAKNTNIGEATVTITGIGAYKGTITTDFIIKPAKEKLTSVKAGKKQITLSYTAQKANGKTGYRIVYSAAKGQAKATNAYTTKATVKGLKSGKTYKVKVRAFKTINGTQYCGTYSSVKKVKVK